MTEPHEHACPDCGAEPADEHDRDCPTFLRNLRGGRGESFEYVRRAYAELLNDVPDRDEEGTENTPRRAALAWRDLTCGYTDSPPALTTFEARHDELVVVAPIPFYSLCEHHLLPFHGRAYVAYLPSGRVVGLSKFARVVQHFARRLQVQERMTTQIADYLEAGIAGDPETCECGHPQGAHTFDPGRPCDTCGCPGFTPVGSPKGLAVVCKAEHLCMSMRGAQVPGTITTTSVMRGAFRDKPEARAEVLGLMGVNGK